MPYEKGKNILTFGTNQLLINHLVALKDVVWLNTNEQVNVIARYAPWDGFYMVGHPKKIRLFWRTSLTSP